MAENDPEAGVADLVQMFEASEQATHDARTNAERDRDYYDSKQLTPQEIAALKERGQPPIVFNLIKTKVNYSLGLEVEQRSDPKAFPRNPDDEEASEAATDALRFVADKEDLPSKLSDVYENMQIEGFGGVEVLVEPKGKPDPKTGRKRLEIVIKRWKWDRLFFDPHSSEHDFSDAEYLGGVLWMDYEKALSKWPGKQEVLSQTLMSAPGGVESETYDDKPRYSIWAENGKRKRVRIVQMYYRKDGDWYWCFFTYGGKLEGGERPVKFLDEDGDTTCPLILQSAYVDRDNNRYGEIRSLIDVQDEVNKRRSKVLHMGLMRQTAAEEGAVDSVREMKKELAKPDGHVSYRPGKKFEILQNNDQIKTQADLLLHAEARFDLMGPNAAMQGKGEDSASGRAIQANQQGGMIEQANLFKRRYRHFKIRVYRAIWNRIRQFWTEERWVRVTDNDNNIRFVGFNRPLTMLDVQLKQAEQQGADKQTLAEMKEQGKQDPELQQPVPGPDGQPVLENVAADMDMDIIVEDAPDTVTIQAEQFEQLVNLASAGVIFPPKTYIRMSQLRDKDAVIDEMETGGKKPSPAEQQALMDAAAIQKAQAEADVMDKQAAAKLKEAQTVKTLQEAQAAGQGDTKGAELQLKAQIASNDAQLKREIAASDHVMEAERMEREFALKERGQAMDTALRADKQQSDTRLALAKAASDDDVRRKQAASNQNSPAK